jgi:hypothetical protein
MTKSELWNYYIKRLVRTGITDAGYSSAAPTSHPCNPCNPWFFLFLVRRDFRQHRRLQQPFLFFLARVHRQSSRRHESRGHEDN